MSDQKWRWKALCYGISIEITAVSQHCFSNVDLVHVVHVYQSADRNLALLALFSMYTISLTAIVFDLGITLYMYNQRHECFSQRVAYIIWLVSCCKCHHNSRHVGSESLVSMNQSPVFDSHWVIPS